MGYDTLFAVSRSGLDYERTRIENASRDIAVANTPIAPGQPTATDRSGDFGAALGLAHGADRLVRDPANPMADANGMVHFPRIDLVAEMGTLVSASRGYEANLRAFNTLRNMLVSALNIGKDQA
ncbi:flagellar basal body rod C-terminal domain-containing protein [Rhodanobacter sp. KK11]|uniref:flagellar basal body rod protein FlgC n=1 Tax=Rhodanobacter sp. KK11 TaxID=3083255 RepID=UPI00296709E9|nr:flagellar basal body rod C-terminal domain-containing protein [Rhodanobacter sp. KK11]MDW2981774.1 flagellar basal body rod C-terminal domain-containing protein [Rhodanobacter sp. KK11]